MFDPLKHHRRSIRLKDYDYSRAGAYFVTVVAQDREFRFGEVVEGVMCLNAAGLMVQSIWDELPAHYPGVGVDEFVVMPNHIHGIIVLARPDVGAEVAKDRAANEVGAAPRGRPAVETGEGRTEEINGGGREVIDGEGGRAGEAEGRLQPPGQARGPAPTGTGSRSMAMALPEVVQRFKSMTTTRYIEGVHQNGWPGFRKRVWQRNYYEEIVRDEAALNEIRRYVVENPLRWDVDEENPARR